MNQDYYFPLFGLFATAGKIFLLSEGGGEQSDKADPEKYARQRRGRFLRVICGSMPALAGLEPPAVVPARLSIANDLGRLQAVMDWRVNRAGELTLFVHFTSIQL